MKVVEVDLGDRTYPIYIGRGLLDQGELLRRHIPGKTALVVTNETVAPIYLDRQAPARGPARTPALACQSPSACRGTRPGWDGSTGGAAPGTAWHGSRGAAPRLLPPASTASLGTPPRPARRCLAAITAGGGIKAEVVVLPDGEQHKSLEVLQRVWDKALECRCGGGGGPAASLGGTRCEAACGAASLRQHACRT
jgi:hypothetical protein